MAGLLEGAEHEGAEDSFFGSARNFFGELLVHAGSDFDFLRDFDLAGSASGAVRGSAITFELYAADGQRAHSERVTPGGRGDFEFVDALRVRLFVDALERKD